MFTTQNQKIEYSLVDLFEVNKTVHVIFLELTNPQKTTFYIPDKGP